MGIRPEADTSIRPAADVSIRPGADVGIRHATIGMPQVPEQIGSVTVVADGDAVIGIYYPDHSTRPDRSMFGPRVVAASDEVIAAATDQLRDYLRGERSTFDFAMQASGDAFQQRVWDILRDIPYGTTLGYGRIAERLGGRAHARLVGRAVGRNPLSIAVPCHRVVGADGDLVGYAGGIARKRFLLRLEGALPEPAPALF